MVYEPTNWQNGDVVTAEKLNKIENGIADSGIVIVDMVWDGVLPQTGSLPQFKSEILASEIAEEYISGKFVRLRYIYDNGSEPQIIACADIVFCAPNRNSYYSEDDPVPMFKVVLNENSNIYFAPAGNGCDCIFLPRELQIGEDGYLYMDIYVD